MSAKHLRELKELLINKERFKVTKFLNYYWTGNRYVPAPAGTDLPSSTDKDAGWVVHITVKNLNDHEWLLVHLAHFEGSGVRIGVPKLPVNLGKEAKVGYEDCVKLIGKANEEIVVTYMKLMEKLKNIKSEIKHENVVMPVISIPDAWCNINKDKTVGEITTTVLCHPGTNFYKFLMEEGF